MYNVLLDTAGVQLRRICSATDVQVLLTNLDNDLITPKASFYYT